MDRTRAPFNEYIKIDASYTVNVSVMLTFEYCMGDVPISNLYLEI